MFNLGHLPASTDVLANQNSLKEIKSNLLCSSFIASNELGFSKPADPLFTEHTLMHRSKTELPAEDPLTSSRQRKVLNRNRSVLRATLEAKIKPFRK